MVTMRDGVRISLCVYRPDGRGRVPGAVRGLALPVRDRQRAGLSAVSVARDRPGRMVRRRRATPMCTPTCAAPAAPRASSDSWMPNEQQDYVELIAWIVEQAWCNGRVGGIGQSYYAMAQWLMATYNPPGLACIAPYDGLVDQYRCSNYHGGIFCSYRSVWYANAARRQPASPRRRRRAGRRCGSIWSAPSPSTRSTTNSGASARPTGGSTRSRCRCSRSATGARWACTCAATSSATRRSRRRRSSSSPAREERVEAHHQFDQVEFHEKELLPFYDLHLKGIEQRLHGRRAGAAVRARRQRLARGGGMAARRARPMCRYYLRKGPSGSVTSLNDGGLSTEPPAADEAPTSYTYPDWEWVNGVVVDRPGRPARSGAARADLHLGAARGRSSRSPGRSCSSSTRHRPDRHPLHRQARRPASAGRGRAREGRAAGLHQRSRRAGCKASHREKDEERSTELRPFYTHTNPQPLTPGEIYRVRHRGAADLLRVQAGATASGSRSPTATSPLTDAVFTHPYHPTLIGTDTIHHDARACVVHPAAGGRQRIIRWPEHSIIRRRLRSSATSRFN